jgi:hypothetical protein
MRRGERTSRNQREKELTITTDEVWGPTKPKTPARTILFAPETAVSESLLVSKFPSVKLKGNEVSELTSFTAARYAK